MLINGLDIIIKNSKKMHFANSKDTISNNSNNPKVVDQCINQAWCFCQTLSLEKLIAPKSPSSGSTKPLTNIINTIERINKKGGTMKKLNLVNILVFLISINLVAQENKSIKNRQAQISFAYPIGSNGTNSMEYSNNFSFNILYGLNGGVNGVEIGSILNYNKGEVNGFQLSGVSNINIGNSKGFVLSGVSNICIDSTSGVLISGLLNYSKQNAKGVQLATTNIAINQVNGFQLGVINYAKKLKGVQFGVFNYLHDGKEGLPIGLFSIVKNGHYELELTSGEVIYANLNYKMGVERFYTIFKTGYSSYKNNPVYSLGLGFGGNLLLSERQKISIDLSYNQIVYNNNWNNNDLNILNKADFNYKYSISKNLSLLIGPSINVYVSKNKIDGEYGTLNIPYSIHTNEWSNGKLSIWVGLNAGLALKL